MSTGDPYPRASEIGTSAHASGLEPAKHTRHQQTTARQRRLAPRGHTSVPCGTVSNRDGAPAIIDGELASQGHKAWSRGRPALPSGHRASPGCAAARLAGRWPWKGDAVATETVQRMVRRPAADLDASSQAGT